MGNQLTAEAASNYGSIQTFFQSDAAKQQLSMSLPQHLSPDRMMRVVLSAALKNPTLLQCTKESMFAAMMTCSEMGLEPDGRHIYLIPFRNNRAGTVDVQVIPSYMGYIKLAYQSGLVQSISAKPVYENDTFKYKYGTGQFLDHEPAKQDRGSLTHAWAMAVMKEGGEVFVVLDREDVMRRKKASKSAGSGPWKQHEAAMWQKSAVRELVKFIPISPSLTAADVADERSDMGLGVVLDVPVEGAAPPPPEPTKSDDIADQLTGDDYPTSEEQAGMFPGEGGA